MTALTSAILTSFVVEVARLRAKSQHFHTLNYVFFCVFF